MILKCIRCEGRVGGTRKVNGRRRRRGVGSVNSVNEGDVRKEEVKVARSNNEN